MGDFQDCPACGSPCGPGMGGTTKMGDGTWVRHCLDCPPRPFTASEKAAHDRYNTVATGFTRAVDELVQLRSGVEAIAKNLQSLGHATPWNFGRDLLKLIEPRVYPRSDAPSLSPDGQKETP